MSPDEATPVTTDERYFRYTAVSGDTAARVAYSFALDARRIVRDNGLQGVNVPLPNGSQISIDASHLWRTMNTGSPAANERVVESVARQLGVEPALALAVAWQESSLDQTARSSTGAVGIMQVEPDTARLAAQDLAVSIEVQRPRDNALAGVFWLRSLLRSYGGDRSAALAAYYEGPGNLARRGYLDGTAAYVSHALQFRTALLACDPALAG